MSQALIASRRPIASRTTSRNVWSAPAVIGDAERAAERAVGRGSAFEQHGQCQLFQKLHLRRLVEHAEAGGDVRFERKLVQELGAEGVDGLHLEAARRLQRARQQPPRRRAARQATSAKRQTGSVENGGIEAGIVESVVQLRERRRTRASPCWRRPPW